MHAACDIQEIAFKNPAFAEEKEVRSVHLLAVKADSARLVDEGGLILGKDPVPGQPVKFRTNRGGLIAYVDIPFDISRVSEPIKEVWLGPKNENLPMNVIYMMSGYGFGGFNIKRSSASYR